MKHLLLTLLHLAVITAKLCGPGGVRAVIVENLLLKQQLIVLRRARQRAPNLTLSDRPLCGFGSLFLSPGRIRKVAIALRPSTLLAFHQALVRRKYHRLFSSRPCPTKSGPKGPGEALIRAIVEVKSRNPRFGCPRIARIISHTFGADIDKNVVYRVLAKHHRPTSGGTGPFVVVVHRPGHRQPLERGPFSSRAPTSAACSMPQFAGRAHRDISVRIMIRCARRMGGRQICGFWRSTKSKPCRMSPCPTHSWSA